ncbi:putative Conserved Peptidylprolyl isomerase [Capnocytophaga canis]|uniref:Putative Conserved Peptidylprolyl isomerase n=1 Tax=Capnocytophaga canis TaxID=1848903 RepID=A0A0B7HXK1_9FLAO|nr:MULTISPECIES: hypothetical protein [Capnocytophaga]CEN44421.1 putative Conserved Peptidylprolyl isomerase [Capnocytophaga canis]CEN53134.1 putative Conserved Peptidylprolyl isomerase [Capnocytophaga canis]
MKIKKYIWLFLGIFIVVSCDYFVKEKPKHAIARVGDVYLYKDEIKSIMPIDYTKEDSINIVQKYINSWAIKELMLSNAERNISDDEKADFERLVNDYRADLYLNSYKQGLINSSIDTLIKEEDLQFFYEANKETFLLNESLIKLRYIHLSSAEKQKRVSALEEKLKRFNAEDRHELDSIGLQFNSIYLGDSIWVKTESVVKKLPFLEEKLKENRIFFTNHKDSTGVYLVQVRDVLRKNEQAPMEYVKPTLRQIILNQRKLEFVKELEADIINRGIKKKQFEIIYE